MFCLILDVEHQKNIDNLVIVSYTFLCIHNMYHFHDSCGYLGNFDVILVRVYIVSINRSVT